jgi:hypothetical protein
VVGKIWFSKGAPLDRSNRWIPYAVAVAGAVVRRHPETDLYATRLRARRALVLVPNYSNGGKVWLSHSLACDRTTALTTLSRPSTI